MSIYTRLKTASNPNAKQMINNCIGVMEQQLEEDGELTGWLNGLIDLKNEIMHDYPAAGDKIEEALNAFDRQDEQAVLNAMKEALQYTKTKHKPGRGVL